MIAALAALLALSACQQKEQDVEARAVATAENLLVFDAQGAPAQTVKVYADGTWAVDTPNEWIHVTPMSGKGMGEVTISVSDNVSGGVVDGPRTGSILIQGGTTERRGSITVKQKGDTYKGVRELTVKEVIVLDDEDVAKIPGGQVAAVTKGGFVLTEDGENLYVQGARDVKVGDMVSLNGAKTTFNNCPSFFVDELEVLSSGTITYPEAPDITANIASFKGGSIPYVTIRGSLVNGALKVGPASIVVVDPVDELKLADVDLHKVALTGYAVGVNGATGYMVATGYVDEGEDETLVPYPLKWAIGKDLNYSSATFNKDNPRIDPIQGIGYLEYVPYDLEHTDTGNYALDVSGNNPRVTGPWVNDYWLFYGNGAILAGTEVQIAFEMRSSAWGMKFWLLEYLDGDEWKVAGTPQTSTEPGYEVQYTVATNPDGSTNVPVMETIRFRRNNEHLQIRMRCSALWRGGGGTTASRSTASSRLSITNPDDDTYRPSIVILKEGNGVEKDPVYADIQVDPELLTFNGTPGAPKTLTVTSDYDWTISTAYDWLHLDVEGGLAGEETTVTVTCDESELSELREGTIRIVSEDSEKVVHVVQSAAGQMLDPFISIVGGNAREVGYEAGKTLVRIQGNVDVEFASDAPWMTVKPGDTRALVEWSEFTVEYEENTAEQTPRTGTIRFYNTEKKLESVLTVTQAGAPASGVYFQDDFEWLEPWAAYTVDDVANNSVGSSPNAFTKAEVAGALAELQSRGYGYIWGWKGQDWSDGLPDNGNKQTLYLMHNYLKFGKTSYNSGIILPALSKMTGTENVDLTFDWCWCMTGASKPDVMTLTVTVTGGGYLADTGTEASGNIESGQPTEGDLTVLAWQHAKVTILEATPATRITIRPTNADPEITSTRKQNRWYLDNIRVEKSDYVPQVNEYFADDFEWLEPWAAYTVDDVANNSVGSSPNAFTKAEVAGALAELQSRGYGYIWGWKGQDWSDGLPDNGNKQTLYLMHNYLKFGKTSYNSGIILPALSGISGTADVDLAFDWCWCMTGASKPDVMTLTVTVTGGGTLADTGTEVSGNIESAQPTEGDQTRLEWQHATVKILGATPSTRITIRPTNADPEVTSTRKQNRWYLDNIRVTGK